MSDNSCCGNPQCTHGYGATNAAVAVCTDTTCNTHQNLVAHGSLTDTSAVTHLSLLVDVVDEVVDDSFSLHPLDHRLDDVHALQDAHAQTAASKQI